MKAASILYRDDSIGPMLGLETVCPLTPDDLDPTEHAFIILHGGEDISPSIYNQKVGLAHASNVPSWRDKVEIAFAHKAVELGIPIFGICRGAQLMCSLLGGKLWQHVNNHAGSGHKFVFEGKEYDTNSYHHQMMIPTAEMEVVGHTPVPLSKYKWGECQDEAIECNEPEPEIVLHRPSKTLMIQGHPEWVHPGHDLYKVTQHLLKELTQ